MRAHSPSRSKLRSRSHDYQQGSQRTALSNAAEEVKRARIGRMRVFNCQNDSFAAAGSSSTPPRCGPHALGCEIPRSAAACRAPAHPRSAPVGRRLDAPLPAPHQHGDFFLTANKRREMTLARPAAATARSDDPVQSHRLRYASEPMAPGDEQARELALHSRSHYHRSRLCQRLRSRRDVRQVAVRLAWKTRRKL